MRPSAAEAGLILVFGTAEAVPFPDRHQRQRPDQVKIKIKVKSVGQECPTHTGCCVQPLTFAREEQQVPHRAFRPIRNDIPFFPRYFLGEFQAVGGREVVPSFAIGVVGVGLAAAFGVEQE